MLSILSIRVKKNGNFCIDSSLKDEQRAILINLIIKSDLKIIVYTLLGNQTQVKKTNITGEL